MEHWAVHGAVYRFRVPVECVNPCGTGAPVPQANGGMGFTADPRLHNLYFGGETPDAAQVSKTRRLPDLVAVELTR